jgi:hypothetical protein
LFDSGQLLNSMLNNVRKMKSEHLEYLSKHAISAYRRITSGYSDEETFVLTRENGERYLLKVCDQSKEQKKRNELHYLEIHRKNGVRCQIYLDGKPARNCEKSISVCRNKK